MTLNTLFIYLHIIYKFNFKYMYFVVTNGFTFLITPAIKNIVVDINCNALSLSLRVRVQKVRLLLAVLPGDP